MLRKKIGAITPLTLMNAHLEGKWLNESGLVNTSQPVKYMLLRSPPELASPESAELFSGPGPYLTGWVDQNLTSKQEMQEMSSIPFRVMT